MEASVRQKAHLFGGNDTRVVVGDVEDADAGDEVNVFSAVQIPSVGSLLCGRTTGYAARAPRGTWASRPFSQRSDPGSCLLIVISTDVR